MRPTVSHLPDVPAFPPRVFLHFALLLAALVLLIYYPVLSAEFVWDDQYVINAQNLHSWGALVDIWLHPSKAFLQDYMPLNYTTNWIEFQMWGENPCGYHAVNLLLHAANALLLFYLLRRLQLAGAFLAALLFAVHPVQVGSIAWVSERKDLLYVFFYFLALFAWMRFDEEKTWQRYLLVFAWFAAGMLSKRMAITWPLVALLLSWWRTGQPQFRNALRLLPFFAFALLLAFIVPLARKMGGMPADILTLPPFSFAQKIILAGNNVAFYAGKLFWPVEHLPLYPRWEINPSRVFLYIAPLTILVVLIVLWALRNRVGRGPFAATAFYLLALSPILGFIPWGLMKSTYVQDHYQYLACIGPFLLFAYAFDKYIPRLFVAAPKLKRLLCGVLASLILIPLVFIAHKHAGFYHDQETLFAENYKRCPSTRSVVLNYAGGLFRNGKYEEGLLVTDQAIALDPSRWDGWRNKGALLLKLERYEEAATAFKQALSLDMQRINIELLNDYTAALIRTPSPHFAPVVPLLEQALSENRQDALTEGNLAIVLSLTGRKADAEKHFENVIQSQFTKTPAQVLYYYGLLCLDKSEPEKALPFLRLAQRVAPCSQYQEAVQRCEAAVKNAAAKK